MPTLQDSVAIVATIDPEAQGAATVTSDYVDMSKFHDIQAMLLVGEMAASSTVDAKLRQATDGSGTGVKDISGKSITQLTQAGTDSDKQVVINCRADELDKDNSFDFVQLSVTVAAAASDLAAVIIGFDSRYEAATANDLASVDEIIS